MILNTRKISISDTSSPVNQVVLTNINEGVDGSAVFGISNEHQELTIEGGQTYIDRASPSLDIRVLKPSSSDLTQLNTWASNLTDLYITGLTLDGVFLFGDLEDLVGPAKISINEQLSDNDILALTVTAATTVGFSSTNGLHQNGFFAGKNVLGIHEWGDADSDNEADGWNLGRFTPTFSAGVQSLENDDSGTVNSFFKKLYFPFEGETLTFSINYDAIAPTADYLTEIAIRQFDANESIVTTDRTTVSSTGRKTQTSTIQPTTVRVNAFVFCQLTGTGSSAVTQVSDPYMSIDGSTTYKKL